MNKTYLLVFLVVCSSILVPLAFAADTLPGTQPNIVVIMTDDQDVASLSHLPKIQNLLTERGTTFKNFMVTCSLCCPSRAVFLTGQYAHNNGVEGNLLPLGGYTRLDHANTLPVWLQNSGYYTGHIGKYLNGYGTLSTALTSSDNIPVVVTNTKDAILQASNDFPAGVTTNDAILAMTVIPPGYSEWYGSIDPTTYKYYNYTLNKNGVLVTYGFTPEDYQTDVYTGIANDFISRRASAPDGKPFFLVIAPVAAHNVDKTPDYPGTGSSV